MEEVIDGLIIENGFLISCNKTKVNVKIPASVRKINDTAFLECKKIKTVEFGGTVEQWEAVKGKSLLLRRCPAMSVKCSDGEWQKPVLLVEDGVVVACLDSSVTCVVIPGGITSIKGRIFYHCKSLMSVEFDGTVTQWKSVKGRNYLLEDVPDRISVKCSDGEWQKPDFLIEDGIATAYFDKNATSVVIPKGVTSIGDGAFRGCTSLTSVVIPESVMSIGNHAFCNCKSLKSIIIPEGVTSIGESAFHDCDSLKSIVIPNGVTSIGAGAFIGCSSLTSVEIPKGVTSIGAGAFGRCTSLTSVEIPKGVTSIGAGAFGRCTSLKSVVIPASVTSISDNIFYNCTSLESVIISEGVTSIGERAFYLCESLASVVIPKSVKQIDNEVFYKKRRTIPLIIKYNGTMKEWLSINRNYYWKDNKYFKNQYSPDEKIVKCTDGEQPLY